MRRASIMLAVLCGCHPESARNPSDPVEAAVATLRAEDLAGHIEMLASDGFEGRFPGTAGENRTLAYVASELRAAGVVPAVNGEYLQPVALTKAQAEPGATLVTDRGAKLAGGGDFLLGSPAGLREIVLEQRDVVFAGFGIVAPEHDWDDYADADVHDKIVVVLAGDPGSTRSDPKFFGGAAMSYHGTPRAKASVAAQRGAAALLVVRDADTGVPWSTLAVGAQGPRYQLADQAGPTLAAMGLLRAERAPALLGNDSADLVAQAAAPTFTARRTGVTATLRQRMRHEAAISHNVVGIIRGRSRPDEVVLYSAHWDHVGRRDQLDGDRIFNGAVDNATGTAALLELAQAYAALERPPARSIVFLATTAEEQGLLGSRYYVDHPVFPLRDTVGVINMDALFPFGVTQGMTVVAMGSSELEPYLERAAAAVGRTLYPDPAPEAGAFFRSDHYPFAERGVPALFAVGGPSPDEATEGSAILARFADYLQHKYHQPADEYDAATWDMGGILQDVEVFFRTGHALAETDAFPNWNADHAFRSRRDAMLRGG